MSSRYKKMPERHQSWIDSGGMRRRGEGIHAKGVRCQFIHLDPLYALILTVGPRDHLLWGLAELALDLVRSSCPAE